MKIDDIGLHGVVDEEWLEDSTMPDRCSECKIEFTEGSKAYNIKRENKTYKYYWLCRHCAKQVKVIQNL